MADRPKMIAVCLSEVHNFLNTGFLNELSAVAAPYGYGVTVFNSSLDFYWYQKDNKAPRACYRNIRFELFEAVFIICHSFHDDELVREIIRGAQACGVTVFLAGMEVPGCYTVVNDFEDGYKDLIRHVIRDHGARDTYYIAGMKDEPNSEGRLKCWQEVLEDFSLPFHTGMLAYGNYWSKPTVEVVRKLIRSRDKLPDAIFCANDAMAIAVCDTLRENGYQVPGTASSPGLTARPPPIWSGPT